VSGLRTEYEFVLPKGYLDASGTLHKRGTMRLATARDELEPLRDPTITSADDPRLTILVLARVVRTLGTLDQVTAHEIEGLFAADLAYLQDFYGVINFGTPADIEALLQSQQEMERASRPLAAQPEGASARSTAPLAETPAAAKGPAGAGASKPSPDEQPALAATAAPTGRRAAIEEVPTTQK